MEFRNEDHLKSFLKSESKRLGVSIQNTYSTFFSKVLLERISKMSYDELFVKGSFSELAHLNDMIRPITDIDLVLVPGISFDVKGHRIGFGKGCYDRLLCNYQGVKIGFCYSSQICDDIPSDEYDVCMDYIITENGLWECNIQE